MNPYSLQRRPAIGDGFVGRKALLQLLMGHLNRQWPESVAIIGAPAMGKSSLMACLGDRLRALPNSVVAQLSGDEYATGSPTPEAFIGKVAGRLRAALQGRVDLGPADLLDDPVCSLASAAHAHGFRVYLLLDRFDQIVRRWGLGPNELVGVRSWMSGPDFGIGLVIATTEHPDTYPTYYKNSMLSTRFARTVTLDPLGPEDVAALVNTPAATAQLPLPAGTCQVIWAQAGGHPFFTSLAAAVVAELTLTGGPPELDRPTWLERLDDQARGPLRSILGQAGVEHEEGLRALVSDHFQARNAPAVRAAEELVRLGLARMDGQACRCVGALFRRHIDRDFGGVDSGPRMATEEERRSFWGFLADVEPRMRLYVEERLKLAGKTVESALPADVSERARKRNGAAQLENITFGELINLVHTIVPRGALPESLEAVGVIVGTRAVRDARNPVAHNVAVRRDTLMDAFRELQEIRRFLDNWVP